MIILVMTQHSAFSHMKFKINRDHFSNGLQQVLNVVGSKATMPILSNVLIEAEKDNISLTTRILIWERCKIKAEVRNRAR